MDEWQKKSYPCHCNQSAKGCVWSPGMLERDALKIMPTRMVPVRRAEVHRSLRSAHCFWISTNFLFRGHSFGFTPSFGIHFPSIGLNRAGHDNSLTIVPEGPGTILVLNPVRARRSAKSRCSSAYRSMSKYLSEYLKR